MAESDPMLARIAAFGRARGGSGPFGIATMPLDQALGYIAAKPAFWIHA